MSYLLRFSFPHRHHFLNQVFLNDIFKILRHHLLLQNRLLFLHRFFTDILVITFYFLLPLIDVVSLWTFLSFRHLSSFFVVILFPFSHRHFSSFFSSSSSFFSLLSFSLLIVVIIIPFLFVIYLHFSFSSFFLFLILIVNSNWRNSDT